MAARADAGVPVQPGGDRGTAGTRLTNARGRASRGRTHSGPGKGLWLYKADERIGRYKSTADWEARAITPGVTYGDRTGFEAILRQVRAYASEVAGLVPKLAIVTHGNLNGWVEIRNTHSNIPTIVPPSERAHYEYLTPFSVHAFKPEIAALDDLLTNNAQVIFYSCLAGGGAEGSYLLRRLSSYLPGRTIIGFTTLGESGASWGIPFSQAKPAGVIYETGTVFGDPEKAPKKWLQRYVGSAYAKHARAGRIVKTATQPASERSLPAWQPTLFLYTERRFFDLLLADRHLYYLGVLLTGWWDDPGARKSRSSSEDYLNCLRFIESDSGYRARKDAGLPKDYVGRDGVLIVHRGHVARATRTLDEQQRKQYQSLKATLRPRFRTDVPVIWRNDLARPKRVEAHLDAMLSLRAGRRPSSATIRVLGRSRVAALFLPPRRR